VRSEARNISAVFAIEWNRYLAVFKTTFAVDHRDVGRLSNVRRRFTVTALTRRRSFVRPTETRRTTCFKRTLGRVADTERVRSSCGTDTRVLIKRPVGTKIVLVPFESDRNDTADVVGLRTTRNIRPLVRKRSVDGRSIRSVAYII